MNNSVNNAQEQAKKLADQMSKFQTVAAAQRWWNAKSPQQKGATIGIIVGLGIGGYAFFATYKVAGIANALWGSVLYGAAAGASTTFIASAAYTSSYKSATKNLGDDL